MRNVTSETQIVTETTGRNALLFLLDAIYIYFCLIIDTELHL